MNPHYNPYSHQSSRRAPNAYGYSQNSLNLPIRGKNDLIRSKEPL